MLGRRVLQIRHIHYWGGQSAHLPTDRHRGSPRISRLVRHNPYMELHLSSLFLSSFLCVRALNHCKSNVFSLIPALYNDWSEESKSRSVLEIVRPHSGYRTLL